MNAKEFTELWKDTPMIKFNLETPMTDGLSEAVYSELKEFGLPKTAEPWLSFMEFLLVDEKTAVVLNELNFYPIGYLANGDIICVDKMTNQIMICDHEELTYTWMLNSSLAALYESITVFREFIVRVNQKNPGFARNYKIPDGMLDELAAKLKKCDSESYNNKGFWFTEIQALSE